jgi:hypothetical protein
MSPNPEQSEQSVPDSMKPTVRWIPGAREAPLCPAPYVHRVACKGVTQCQSEIQPPGQLSVGQASLIPCIGPGEPVVMRL